jgi:hypothetical protein
MYDDDKRPDDSKHYHAKEGSVPYRIHAALAAPDILDLIARKARARYPGPGKPIDAARVRRRVVSGATSKSLFLLWAREDGTEDKKECDQKEGGIAHTIHQELLSPEVVRLVSERAALTEEVVRPFLNELLAAWRRHYCIFLRARRRGTD